MAVERDQVSTNFKVGNGIVHLPSENAVIDTVVMIQAFAGKRIQGSEDSFPESIPSLLIRHADMGEAVIEVMNTYAAGQHRKLLQAESPFLFVQFPEGLTIRPGMQGGGGQEQA